MGQAHADAYRRAGILYGNLPIRPVLYAIADQNDTLAEQARGRLGFTKAYGDWRRFIEVPEVDIVDITTPNHLHVEPALAALEAGKHVYCEKPMAVKVPSLPWSWRCSRKLAGTGALGDLGAHTVSVAQFPMGDVTGVCAQAQTLFKERPLPEFDAGYGSKVGAGAKKRTVANEDQIQFLVEFHQARSASSRLRASVQVAFLASFGRSPARRGQSRTTANGSTSFRFFE